MVFIDAIHVKIRDGQVANRPIYVALAVTCEGHRDILGLWAGDGGEGAKYWLHVLTELKNRGVGEVLMVVCDGLTGLPDAINTVWPQTVVQTCIVHLLRNSFRYAGRQHWDAIAKALKPVYTASTEAAARERFAEFAREWGGRYPAIVRLWDNAWAEFVPFLGFDPEIRRVICSTNAIESVNARIRRAVKARGHFPTEQAALKCVYMAVMSLDPTGSGRKRWMMSAGVAAVTPVAGDRDVVGRRMHVRPDHWYVDSVCSTHSSRAPAESPCPTRCGKGPRYMLELRDGIKQSDGQ